MFGQVALAQPIGGAGIATTEAVQTMPTTTQAATQATGLSEEVQEYAKFVKMTDEQKKKMEELVAAKDRAFSEWETANEDRLKEINVAIESARKARDLDAYRKSMVARNELLKGNTEIYREYDPFQVLTQEQKKKWFEHTFLQALDLRYRAVNLTDEQKEKMRTVVGEVLKGATLEDLADLTDLGDRDDSPILIKKLLEKVATILTDEQKAKHMQALKASLNPTSAPAK